MRHSIGKWLLTAAFAALLLCLSTALIQTTAPPTDAPAAPAQAMLPPALRPATLPAPDTQSDLPQDSDSARVFSALPAQRLFAATAAPRHTDANGHVLQHRQYVYSVYQTFRQETACG